METLKEKALKVKDHVNAHRGIYAACTLALVAIALQPQGVRAVPDREGHRPDGVLLPRVLPRAERLTRR
jgi:hypothetical protein